MLINILKLIKTKTFWVNLIGLGLLVVNELTGKYISTESAATIVFFLNLGVRLLTTKPVSEK